MTHPLRNILASWPFAVFVGAGLSYLVTVLWGEPAIYDATSSAGAWFWSSYGSSLIRGALIGAAAARKA